MNALHRHYLEYLMEVAGLGLFMLSASVVTVGAKLHHQNNKRCLFRGGCREQANLNGM